MYVLDVEPLDLGPDVRAIGLELVEADENREPVRGSEAAAIWSRVLRATARNEPWVLDFFSHIDRVREFCDSHQIAYREANQRLIVIPAPEAASLDILFDRFQRETFGARAGSQVKPSRRTVTRHWKANWHGAAWMLITTHSRSTSSALSARLRTAHWSCLSEKLWASEVIRRVRPDSRGPGR